MIPGPFKAQEQYMYIYGNERDFTPGEIYTCVISHYDILYVENNIGALTSFYYTSSAIWEKVENNMTNHNFKKGDQVVLTSSGINRFISTYANYIEQFGMPPNDSTWTISDIGSFSNGNHTIYLQWNYDSDIHMVCNFIHIEHVDTQDVQHMNTQQVQYDNTPYTGDILDLLDGALEENNIDKVKKLLEKIHNNIHELEDLLNNKGEI